MENKVIVLCGAPGSGKTTVRKYLTENFAIEPVLTHTTRPKRKGEHDGIDYWFETRETFLKITIWNMSNMTAICTDRLMKVWNAPGKRLRLRRSFLIQRVRKRTWNGYPKNGGRLSLRDR